MWFFKKKNNIDYNKLVSVLQKGDVPELQSILWQPRSAHVDYLPVVITWLHKLKQPETSDKGLSIYKKIAKGHFELIIFNIPWKSDDLPFAPLVIDTRTGTVVGVMLPFNELHGHISKKDNSMIGELGGAWVLFTMEYSANNSDVNNSQN